MGATVLAFDQWVKHLFVSRVDERTTVRTDYEQSFDKRLFVDEKRKGRHMAAVAVVLDHEEAWVSPVQRRRPDLRLVPAAAPLQASRPGSARLLPILLGCAALLSVLFVLSTGDGIPASADTRGAATALQSVVPPIGAVAATPVGSKYVVRHGDSVWSIAAMTVSAAEVPDYVDNLIALNGTEVLSPGQVLLLPVP